MQPYSGKNISEFEKPVAQLVVRTLSATIWTPPKENLIKLDLSLL
jgi:hypothetical protein